jgi:hypothetical protein
MDNIFLFFIWPIILLMLFLTHCVKRRFVLWIFILTPPISLLSLWWIPWAKNTIHFIWVPAIIAMWISLVSSFIRICIIAHNWKKRSSETGQLRLVKLVRPVLVVLIMGGLFVRERIAHELFKTYAIELGQHIQEICDLEGKPPKIIEGWDVIQENSTFCASASSVTKIGRKASVRYEDIIRAKEFRILVNYGNLSYYSIRGGVGRKLKAFGNGRRINIGLEKKKDETS